MDSKTKDLEKKELSDEEAENVSGGYVYQRSGSSCDKFQWSVIDDETGRTLKLCFTQSDAEATAEKAGKSTAKILSSDVDALRNLYNSQHPTVNPTDIAKIMEMLKKNNIKSIKIERE